MNSFTIFWTLVVGVVALSFFISNIHAAIHDFVVRNAADTAQTENVINGLYDPDSDMIIYSTYVGNTGTASLNYMMAWPLSTSPSDSIIIGGDGQYLDMTTQTAATSSSFKEQYGLALAMHPSDGSYFGWLVTQSTASSIGLISKTAPYATTAWVAGDGSATYGYADGIGAAVQFDYLYGLCHHRGAMKAWAPDSGANCLIRELVWDVASSSLNVSTLAGTQGSCGYVDGDASAAQFSAATYCAVAPTTGPDAIAMFIPDDGALRLRRLTPVSPTGSVSTIYWYDPTYGGSGTTGLYNSPCAVFTRSDGIHVIAAGDTAYGMHFFHVTTEMLSAPTTWYSPGYAWNPINISTGDDANLLGMFFLPNGTVVTTTVATPPAANLKIWDEQTYSAATGTKSKSITINMTESHIMTRSRTDTGSLSECIPNPVIIDQGLTYPEGSIAPVTDSIFDFNSFTPQCCGKITEFPFSVNCRYALGNCTYAMAGANMYSSNYLLHGTFATTDDARAWALNCLPAYATCMREGYATNSPLELSPICRWPTEANDRLNDPNELAIFAAAAIVGMNSPEILDVVDEIAYGSGGNGDKVMAPTSAPPGPPPSPASIPSSSADIVARIASCPAAQPNYRCLRKYGSTSSCSCPSTTTLSESITLMTAWASLAPADPIITALPAAVQSCVRDPMTLSMCTSAASPNAWISAHEQDVTSFTLNGTLYRVGGSCVIKNPQTTGCACPYNTSAHEFAVPMAVDDGTGSLSATVMRIVTFCMRPGMTVFFEGFSDWDASAPECFHPFGSNYTCTCTAGAKKRIVPTSIYRFRNSTSSVPGQLVFCNSDVQYPAEVDPAVIATTIGVTIATGISGGNLDALQAAAVAMSVCGGNESDGNSKKAVVFAELGFAEEAGGLIFMLLLAIGLVLLHWLVAVLICCFFLLRGRAVPESFDTGLYPLIADANIGKNSKNKYEEGGALAKENSKSRIARSIDKDGQTQSVWHVWEYAATRIRFPHYSILVIRVLFAGFASESAAMFRHASDNGGYYGYGAGGLLICVIFMLIILFFSWRGISQYEHDDLLLSEIPDEFDLAKEEFAPPAPDDVQEMSLKLGSPMSGGARSGSLGFGGRSPAGNSSPNVRSGNASPNIRSVELGKALKKSELDKQEQEMKEADVVPGPKQIRVKTIEEREEEERAQQQEQQEQKQDGATPGDPEQVDEDKTATPLTAPQHVEEASTSKIDHHALDNTSPGMFSNSLLDPKLEAGLYGERLVIGGEVVRIAPYFVWYTHDFGFSTMPRCLQWWFLPRGWWTNRRGYTKRYAAFYYTFVPRHIKWAPFMTTLFLFVIALLGTTNECEVPLVAGGVINLLMAILFIIAMPLRRPMENVFSIMQYALNCGLGITRGLGLVNESLYLFYTVAGFSAFNVVYVGCATFVEFFWMWDAEIARFHCPKTIDPETNCVDPDAKKSSD